jgi:hypothetical protein
MRRHLVRLAVSLLGALALVVPATAGHASSIAKPNCPKVLPALPFKVGHDYGHPAPRKPAVAVLCVYNTVDTPQALLGKQDISNPVGFARALNASQLLPKVQNFACTLDIGPTSVVILREVNGRTTYISHEEYSCGFLRSRLTANKYHLTDANRALWEKYHLGFIGPVGTK